MAPAGDFEILKAVIDAGADAVYVGGPAYGARAYANNFSQEELLEAIDYVHLRGRKLYLTVNTLLKNDEMDRFYEYLLPYYRQGLDAVIVQDFGVLSYIKEQFPNLAIHASTQMTITGSDGAEFLKQMGVERVVTARELSFEEIRIIKDRTGVEIESFVHGALCYSYSGQCMLSSMLGGRSGNRGRCAQPCRLAYEAMDAHGKSIQNQEAYLLSPKDLCTITMIPQLIDCGIDSFKIEGRMKSLTYAAGVTAIYRKYIDFYYEKGAEAFSVSEDDKQKLLDLGNRNGFTKGYYVQHNGADMITMTKSAHKAEDVVVDREASAKIAISGQITLKAEQEAVLMLQSGDEIVVCQGAVVQKADKKPLTKDVIGEKISKMGNTPFILESIDVDMEEAVFMPIGQLNELRRAAIEQLQEQILADYRRNECAKMSVNYAKESCDRTDKEQLVTALVTNRAQLQVVLHTKGIRRIYVESHIYSKAEAWQQLTEDVLCAHAQGMEFYLAFPWIFREKTRERYLESTQEWNHHKIDGILVRNYEEIGFLRETIQYQGAILMDYNIYTWSDVAQQAFASCGLTVNTIPMELNAGELRQRDNSQSEWIVYGRMPLMFSAGCIHKTLGKCQKQEEVWYLKDRYQKMFPVINDCENCYNIIYNTCPTVLFDMKKERMSVSPMSIRLQFVTETGEETKRIIHHFQHCMNIGEEYTRGHMRRKVE